MIRFLKKLLVGLKHYFRNRLTAQPQELGTAETVGRFIYKKSDVSWATNQPKQKVFLPEMHPTLHRWETSVCRIDLAPGQKVWEIGDEIRKPLKTVARADIGIQSLVTEKMIVTSAPETYSEHAVILNWPDAKDKQKEIAATLVYHSSLKVPSP